MNVTIPDLTGAECGDIAITAAEGGIGYWSQIDSYNYERWTDAEFESRNLDVADDFVFYTIREDVNDNGLYEGEPTDITPELIKRGFGLAISDSYMLSLLTQAREDWTGMIDSIGADTIIQFGVFGKLVYG